MARQILLVDRCPLIPLGLGRILKGSEFQIAFATDSITQAIDHLDEEPENTGHAGGLKRVDMILCDFQFDDGSSLQLQTVAKRMNIPLVLFSHHQNPEFAAAMMHAGAMGFISKTCNRDEILAVLQQITDGKPAWTRTDIRRFTGALATTRLEGHIDFPLTQREFDVLNHVAGGKTNKMIAESMGISYETVKEHVQRVILKLNTNDRTQAALAAVRAGLL